MHDPATEQVALKDAVGHVLEEVRMVLPGVQALFGFQLIAVFNEAFHTRLTADERILHLVAVCLCLLCIVTILAPAAWHRQVEPRSISERFVRGTSWALTAAMGLLLVALTCDFHLIVRIITDSAGWANGMAAAFAAVAGGLWFVAPWCVRCRRWLRPDQ